MPIHTIAWPNGDSVNIFPFLSFNWFDTKSCFFDHSIHLFRCSFLPLHIFAHVYWTLTPTRSIGHYLISFRHFAAEMTNASRKLRSGLCEMNYNQVWSCMFELSDLCDGSRCISVTALYYEKCLTARKSRSKKGSTTEFVCHIYERIISHFVYKTWAIGFRV